MDFSKLDGPQRITAIGGVTLLVASFLPWYSFLGFGLSGWNSGGIAVIGIMVGLASAGLATYSALLDPDLRIGSLAASQVALSGGAVSTALIVLRLVTALSGVSIGLLLGAVGAAAILVGSYRSVTAAGLEMPFASLISKSKED